MPISIKNASSFWIEAGAMSGPPDHRHQIEFPNDLAEFFDDQAREDEVLLMRFPGCSTMWRPLTYRGTDYGQWTNIWRLGLLTRLMGGPEYSSHVIKFDRLVENRTIIYEINVVEYDTQEFADWKKKSEKEGQTGITGGHAGRHYGFW